MSHTQQLSFLDKALVYLFFISLALSIGTIAILAIGTAINHDWFFALINSTMPLMILGFVLLGLSVKLMEILK